MSEKAFESKLTADSTPEAEPQAGQESTNESNGFLLFRKFRVTSKTWAIISSALAFLPLIPILVMLVVIGWHSRIVADDWWFIATTHEHGFPQAVLHWYMTWTGRYTYAAAMTIASLFGPGYSQIFIVGWFLVWFLSGLALLKSMGSSWMLSIGGAMCLVVFPCLMANDIGESIYWLSALATYAGGVIWIMITATVLILWRKKVTVWSVTSCFVVAILAGGFNEVSVAYLDVLLFAALIATRNVNVLAAFLAVLIATALQLHAPGNHARTISDRVVHHSIAWCLHKSYRQAELIDQFFFSLPIGGYWPDIFDLPSFGLDQSGCITWACVYLGALLPIRFNWRLGLAGAFAFPFCGQMAFWLACFIGTYAIGTRLPDRSMTIPYFALLTGFIAAGSSARQIYQALPKFPKLVVLSRFAPIAMFIMACVITSSWLGTLVSDNQQAIAFSSVVDKGIRQAESGTRLVTIPAGAYAWWTPLYLTYFACHDSQQIEILHLKGRQYTFINDFSKEIDAH